MQNDVIDSTFLHLGRDQMENDMRFRLGKRLIQIQSRLLIVNLKIDLLEVRQYNYKLSTGAA